MTERGVVSRRSIVASTVGLAALAAMGPSLAATLALTPRQAAGPFYPAQIPLDSDNDLVTVEGRSERAAGEIAHVFGRVLDLNGRAVAGARVEIWQCDAFGRYHHPRDPSPGQPDPNFQGFGHMVTGGDGAYRFRTIKPVPYPGRTPHIHFALSGAGRERWTTQLYIAGHPLNARDFLLRGVRDPAARARLLVPFEPAPEIEAGALKAVFDIVLG